MNDVVCLLCPSMSLSTLQNETDPPDSFDTGNLSVVVMVLKTEGNSERVANA